MIRENLSCAQLASKMPVIGGLVVVSEVTEFVLSYSGKRTEEAPEACRSAQALDARQAHRSLCKWPIELFLR